MNKKFIPIFLVSMLIVILFAGCTGNDSVDNANTEDIDIIITPNSISITDYNETITINVELKNIANERKKIVPVFNTNDITCKLKSSSQTFSYTIKEDILIDDQKDVVLKPGESFVFSFDLPLSRVMTLDSSLDFPKSLQEENPVKCSLYISLKFDGESADSNTIQLNLK